MDVKGKLELLLEVEGDIEARKAVKAELRGELAAEAIRRWEEEGAAPSWKAPSLGTASLCGTDSREPVVVDRPAWEAWAAENHPESVELVLRLPVGALKAEPRLAVNLVEFARNAGGYVSTEVASLLLGALSSKGVATPDDRLVTEEGELVDGVEFHPKEPYLRVVLDKAAKARARAAFDRARQPEPDPTAEAIVESPAAPIDDYAKADEA